MPEQRRAKYDPSEYFADHFRLPNSGKKVAQQLRQSYQKKQHEKKRGEVGVRHEMCMALDAGAGPGLVEALENRGWTKNLELIETARIVLRLAHQTDGDIVFAAGFDGVHGFVRHTDEDIERIGRIEKSDCTDAESHVPTALLHGLQQL
jgi:hypothetical protein